MGSVKRMLGSILGEIFITSSLGLAGEANELKGYMLRLVTVKNKDWIAECRPKTAAFLKKYGGRLLARGKPVDVLEGKAPNASAILFVEFPTVEKARAWYNNPEYNPLIELRQTGSEADFVLVKELST